MPRPYKLIRSDRKTAQLRITEDGIVEVRAPLAANKAWLDEFVASKEKWIAEKLSATASRVEAKQEFVIDYGCNEVKYTKRFQLGRLRLLKGGTPMPSSELESEVCKLTGSHPNTVTAAKKDLKVVSLQFGRKWFSILPGQNTMNRQNTNG
jgi:predicted metal-dependent hydrolase